MNVTTNYICFQSSCIFEYDNRFFRRMAYVETNDGQVQDTYPDDYNGGIWRVQHFCSIINE